MTQEDPEPEKESWLSLSGESQARITGFARGQAFPVHLRQDKHPCGHAGGVRPDAALSPGGSASRSS